MRVSTMRRVDQWIGLPICVALTAMRKVAGLLRRPATTPVSSIVFIKLAEQGSTVLAAGAFRRAVAKVGRENVYFLCFEENRFICDVMELIPRENVVTIRATSLVRVVLDTLGTVGRLRRMGIDATVDLEFFARSTAILGALSGARHRAGFHPTPGEGRYRGNLLTHPVRFNPHLHSSQSFELLVAALDEPTGRFPTFDVPVPAVGVMPPPFAPSDDEIDVVRGILSDLFAMPPQAPLILLNPNCSDLLPIRAWPTDRYIELAHRLLERDPQLRIGLTGGPGEADAVDAIAAQIDHERCRSLAGRTTLRQLLVLYGLAELLVTNDSGPAHFATLTPIDVITLFGPEHPRLFAAHSPRNHVLFAGLPCSPCVSAMNDRITDCRDNRCMQEISVDAVELAAQRVLERRRSGGGEERPLELEILMQRPVASPS